MIMVVETSVKLGGNLICKNLLVGFKRALGLEMLILPV